MHFESILDLLHRLYQESSIITFGTTICDEASLMKEYQTKSDRLIKETITDIENMFRNVDDLAYVINRIRMILYGYVFKATMEREFEKIK